MILDKLSIIELEVKFDIYQGQNKLKAIRGIIVLLNQIDFGAEIVPTDDIDKLSKLLYSLKGSALNENECDIIKSLIE